MITEEQAWLEAGSHMDLYVRFSITQFGLGMQVKLPSKNYSNN